MPKNKRLSLKELKRRDQVREIERLTFIRKQVGSFINQGQLDTMLLAQEDAGKRKVLFDFIKPFIKFANPQFPTNLESIGGLVSVKPKIIQPPSQFQGDDDKIIRI